MIQQEKSRVQYNFEKQYKNRIVLKMIAGTLQNS